MSIATDWLRNYRLPDGRLDLALMRESCLKYTQPWEPEEVLVLIDRIEELEKR